MRVLPGTLVAALIALLAMAAPASAATLRAIELQTGSEVQEVAFDAGGAAWVTGINVLGRPAVFRVAPEGTVTRHDWSVPGTVRPQGILLGEDGLLYVCLPADDAVDRRSAIYRVSPASGEVLASFELTTAKGQGDGCWDLAAGPPGSGRVYFSGRSSSWVGYVDLATGNAATVPLPGSGPRRPIGITVGPDGRIWFTLYEADAVASVDPSLADFRRVDLATGARPRDLVPWTDGALWVTEEGGAALTRVTTDGQVSRIPLAAGVRPNRLVTAPDGTLWFSAAGSRVGRRTADGTVALYQLPAGTDPRGLAIGPDATIWFAGEGSGVLYGLPLDLAPVLSAAEAEATSSGRATVTVEADARGTPSTLTVDFGPTTAYGTTTTIDAGAFDGPTRRTVTFDGLAPGTHHYRVRAANAFGERIGPDQTVVVPAPPKADTDGDGIPDDLDCADEDPNRHQGRPEVLGDRVDDDCDGVADPFGTLSVSIAYVFEVFEDGTRFKTFTVSATPPAGAKVRMTCKAPRRTPRACPFKRETAKFREAKRKVRLVRRFERRHLPFGTRLELRVSAPRRVGAVRVLRVRKTGIKVTRRCLTPGEPAPARCPR